MPYIYAKHLKKSFKKGNKTINVLNDVSLDISSPGLYFVLGESGEGKTTFGNILLGYEKKSDGILKINFKNRPYGTIIFQDYQLFNELTLYENLTPFGNKEDIDKHLNKLSLENKKDCYPNTLSGGETQRVSLIRALLSEVPLIVADEPTSALDMVQTNKVISALYEASKTRIVIIITHNILITSLYPSTIYRLEQGILTKETSNKIKISGPIIEKKFHFHHGIKTVMKICYKNFIKSYKRFVYSIFVFLISICLGICGLSFMNSIPDTIDKLSQNYVGSNLYEISEVKNINNDSKLNLNQYLRPNSIINDELINQGFTLYPSLGYLMNIGTFFYPIDNLYGLSQDNIIPLISNDIKENEIWVNELFMDKYQCEIGDKIRFLMNLNLEYSINDKNIIDNLTIDEEWTISKICSETNFLNVSTLFYPFHFIIDELEKIQVKNLSYEMGENISWKDRITIYASDDEDICDGKIIAHSPYNLKESISKLSNISDISFSNRATITKSTFDEIYDPIRKLILVFTLGLFFVSIASLLMNIREGIVENRSSFAIISSFRINPIYAILISSYQIIISLVLSMIFVPLFSLFFNKIINLLLSQINPFLCFYIPFNIETINGLSLLRVIELFLILFHLIITIFSLYLQKKCTIGNLLKEVE